MNATGIVYLALSIIAGAIVALMGIGLHGEGSPALPLWRAVTMPGELSAAHAFLEDRCESCHKPVSGPTNATCAGCHATATEVLTLDVTAFHATATDCAGCHVEHRGRAARPITMNHALLVVGARRLRGLTWNDRLEESLDELSQIFRPDRTNRPASDVAMIGALDCRSCHATGDRHQAMLGPDCATCHGVRSWRIDSYLHPSPRSTDCAQCHRAPPSHYMGHFEMVSRRVAGQHEARVEDCHACHRVTAWNDIKGVGWFKHH